MYFPYLRGRQFDLIALRESLNEGLINKNIIPIIEPVRTSSTLKDVIQMFHDKQREIILIRNPKVGTFDEEYASLSNEEQKQFDLIYNLSNVINGYIIEYKEDFLNIDYENPYVLFINSPDLINFIEEEKSPKYIFVPEGSVFKRKLKNQYLVIMESRFVEEKRNSDYLLKDGTGRDIFYSSDHAFYRDEGYKGFADYSVVSKLYSDGGFAPFAVAFHLVYFTTDEKETLNVKSFVSKSNDSIRDPAGKYHEALKMLKEWMDEEHSSPKTYAVKQFLRHYSDGSYPGLGTVKKLAFIHHFEMISKYLVEKE